jgi:hypothetical protein
VKFDTRCVQLGLQAVYILHDDRGVEERAIGKTEKGQRIKHMPPVAMYCSCSRRLGP